MEKGRVLSFKNAFSGIWIALKDEPHLKFHFFAAFLAVLMSWYFQLSAYEWLVVIFSIGLVISLELTNTAIEEIVNSFTENAHPAAKKAKDVSAGAVLIASLSALIIGLIIFLPKILHLLS